MIRNGCHSPEAARCRIVRTRPMRMGGAGRLRLGGLAPFRKRGRTSRGPQLLPGGSSTMAAVPVTIDLSRRAYHPDGDKVRLKSFRGSDHASVTLQGTNTIEYRSSRLFLGADAVK